MPDPEFPARRIDWPNVSEGRTRAVAFAPGKASCLLVEVLSECSRLSQTSDLQEVVRGAAQFATRRLGIERISLFLRSQNGAWMRGTFGTGADGTLVDERGLSYRYGSSDAEAQRTLTSGAGAWLQIRNAPLVDHSGGVSQVLGRGWVALTPLRACSIEIGTLYNDTAFSGAKLDPEQQGLLAVFAGQLAHVIASKRHLFDSHHGPRYSAPVQTALGLLRAEPTLSGGVLAKKLGITHQHLSRTFRKEVGLALIDYRNKLRIERFLGLLDSQDGTPGEHNLLDTALAAGFGSYAQFHRVFRQTLGSAPREYIARGRCGHGPTQSAVALFPEPDNSGL